MSNTGPVSGVKSLLSMLCRGEEHPTLVESPRIMNFYGFYGLVLIQSHR